MSVTLNNIRTQLRAGAVGVTGGSLTLITGRCVLGIDVLTANNTFLADLSTSGPYLSIHQGALTEDQDTLQTSTRPRRYEIPCSLYFGWDREAAFAGTTVEDLLEALRTQWLSGTGMSGVSAPTSMLWDTPEMNVENVPGAGKYRLSVSMWGCG